MKKGQHKSTICVGKALGKAGIPKRMLANEVKLAIHSLEPICPFKGFIYFYIMKHSQTIGILLCLALIYATTQPFVIIESRNWVITGWNPVGSSFGQSGKFLSFFAVLSTLFFALPYIWAKRFNMVFGALMLAWAFRNFLILSTCQMGECPQRQWALYGCIILSGLILLMTFLPKIKVN